MAEDSNDSVTRSPRDEHNWALDGSLERRMNIAMRIMLRGKGSLRSRVFEASESLVCLSTLDFPQKHQEAAGILLDIRKYSDTEVYRTEVHKAFSPSVKHMKNWTSALYNIYRDLLVATGVHAHELHISYLDAGDDYVERTLNERPCPLLIYKKHSDCT